MQGGKVTTPDNSKKVPEPAKDPDTSKAQVDEKGQTSLAKDRGVKVDIPADEQPNPEAYSGPRKNDLPKPPGSQQQ
jgi:hypothetical protein